MTKLYLVRHGQSRGNITHTFTGQTDMELTERGITQADLTGKYLADVRFDAAYSSPLVRALRTCGEIIKYHDGLTYTAVDEIKEIYAGKWEGMLYDDIEKKYPEAYTVWKTKIGSALCTGGESLTDVYNRVCPAFERIIRQNPDKTVLVVAHGAVLRTFLTRVYGYPTDRMNEIPWTTNASVTVVNHDKGKYGIELFSYDGHLGELASKFPKNV